MIRFFLTIFFCFTYLCSISQSEKRKIFAKKISEEIVLDGEMNESFWKNASSSSGYVQYTPRDSVPAELDTEFRVAYYDKFI